MSNLYKLQLRHSEIFSIYRQSWISKLTFALFLYCLFFFSIGHTQEWMQNIVDLEFQNTPRFFKKDVKRTWQELNKKNENFLYYQIKNNCVYGEKNQIHDLLSAICAKYPVKDMNLIYYMQDYIEQSIFTPRKRYTPIFTSAKKVGDQNVILFADWYFKIADCNESKISSIPNNNVDPNSWGQLIPVINMHYKNIPWKNRLEQMVWRGGANDGAYTQKNWTQFPRGTLVSLSKETYPRLINANFSLYHPWTVSDQNFFMNNIPPSSLLPTKQMEYKYQIDIDGVTATFTALSWKLLSGSLVFKQQSNDIMWFHYALKPWEHYIPVDRNLTDVADKIMWAIEHDEKAKEIADNGRQFALTHLMPEDILLYCYLALCKYASLQRN